MSFTLKIKNAGKLHEITLAEGANGSDLKTKIWEKTQIPSSRQKILIKGGKLTDEVVISSLNLNLKTHIMVLGTPDKDLPIGNAKNQVFMEELDDRQLGKTSHDPSGLQNLGNTCYLNSSLQTIFSMKDICAKIQSYNGTANPLVRALKNVFDSMSQKKENVAPMLALMQFRSQFPQFAEQEMGVYKQQDAEEAYSQLLNSLGSVLEIDDLLRITYKVLSKDLTSAEESESTEVAFKLNCYIDIKTNFLRDGIMNGLKESIEKFNDTLQVNTEHQLTKTITRLPKYLTVHFVRFFWRTDTKKKSKILRKVLFPFELDLAEMLDESIKAEKIAVRDQLRSIEKENLDLVRDYKKAKKDTSLTPQQQAEEDEMKVASIKSRFKDDFASVLPKTFDIDQATENPSSVYELTTVITHSGISADSGHYQAFSKDENDLQGDAWWRFDDNKVYPVTKEKIETLAGGGESDSALILVYKAKGL
ncbi:cysteine proteinase [Metschnikowia bicuspidata var. bicuspidata NRRL YB-4993]|uniref:ubiquitinyl hydrolase 1 n=1 Tax=Metschnikowia bicuspidata var. bicuspidata NRRL YB-4993 TaxID=869754 RepID=A0A1A0HGC6_9ASCO|nr:cysteine proteinase [Metschnikowia bicuspidata var. bicuspidata NRRL YB-4993]OBA22908.1 cysteine proteinase [Metschnikowia bicuspidata var. bicuspidata NRRL YB-4993]